MRSLSTIVMRLVNASLFFVPRMAAADDKATHGFLTESNNPGGAAAEGNFGATLGRITNIFAVLKKGWSDTVSSALRALIVAVRTSPVGDTLYADASFPIGSIFIQDIVASQVHTGAAIFLKTDSTGIWPLVTGKDANQDFISQASLSDAAVTLTAAQVYGGEAKMTPTAARNVTLPAAADLLALMPNARVGTTIQFALINLAAATHALTVVASATITNGGRSGDLTVAAAATALYRVRFTNVTSGAEAAVVVRVGTV